MSIWIIMALLSSGVLRGRLLITSPYSPSYSLDMHMLLVQLSGLEMSKIPTGKSDWLNPTGIFIAG